MKLTALKKWEVKTGKNRGFYIAATPKQAQKFFPEWNMLDSSYASTGAIRRRHAVPEYVGGEHIVILTHSIWSYGVMRKEWERVITQG